MLQSQPQDPALDNLCDTFPPLSAALSKGVYFVVNLIFSTHLPIQARITYRHSSDLPSSSSSSVQPQRAVQPTIVHLSKNTVNYSHFSTLTVALYFWKEEKTARLTFVRITLQLHPFRTSPSFQNRPTCLVPSLLHCLVIGSSCAGPAIAR
jgi:hypothetical protein